jgi:hypothetical protein
MVYWRNCTIKVYSHSDRKKVLERLPESTGQLRLDHGIDLLFDGGEVKEG